MISIYFFGQLYSNRQRIEFLGKGLPLDNAADTFQKLFIQGLEKNNFINIISFPRVPSFPKSKFFFRKDIDKDINHSFYSLSFINIPILKYFSKIYYLSKFLRRNAAQLKDSRILIYSLHTPLLIPFLFFKKDFPIILIVPDLPEYMSSSTNILYRIGKRIDRYILKRCLKRVDGFVLLSKHMSSIINPDNKPWTLVEGMYSDTNPTSSDIEDVIQSQYILYTGTLSKRYGIIKLINAFLKAELSNTKLVICGSGEAEESIKSIQKRNHNIIFKGQLPRENILRLQKQATLLVNPRTSDGEYTKYSFPSKTMEYLASGTPTLMYRLPGVPTEYYKYFFSPDDESDEALKNKLKEILSLPQDELNTMGEKARNFILKHKSPIHQIDKIINLFEIINHEIYK